jgi:hypothetical protein
MALLRKGAHCTDSTGLANSGLSNLTGRRKCPQWCGLAYLGTYAGHQVIVVSSGAVGVGCQRMGLTERPTDQAKLQAVAAVGQVHLMRYYEDLLAALGLVGWWVGLSGRLLERTSLLTVPEPRQAG